MDAVTEFDPTPQFELSEAQRAIAEMARDFADTNLAPHALEWDQQRFFPVDVIRTTAPLGMGGIYVREASGGSGLGRLEAALIFEALATGCPAISAYISIHNMVAWMVDRYGDAAQRARFLPDLVSMKTLASYCLTEPGCGSDAAALTTKARLDGADYVLDGTKQFISGAGETDIYLVMARTGAAGAGGISCFIVPRDAAGLSFGPNERKMGWNAQPTRQVVLESVRIPATNRLGAEGDGFRIAMSGLDGGRLNIGACSIGGAQKALELAITFMNGRTAFGKRLDEFQALQFRLADMATTLESARIMLWYAAAALDRRASNATRLCAMAKRLATDSGFEVANQALQLHGGYGYLADYGIEKIVRDLRVHQILEGTNEIMRLIIARDLVKTGS
jgi:alkylation response protein AidB-like acyl-CoA dehydrogenase